MQHYPIDTNTGGMHSLGILKIKNNYNTCSKKHKQPILKLNMSILNSTYENYELLCRVTTFETRIIM